MAPPKPKATATRSASTSSWRRRRADYRSLRAARSSACRPGRPPRGNASPRANRSRARAMYSSASPIHRASSKSSHIRFTRASSRAIHDRCSVMRNTARFTTPANFVSEVHMSVPAEQATAPAGKQTTIAQLKPPPAAEGNLPQVAIGFSSLQAFELTQRVAKMFATSTVVPDTFKGNIGNCAIALEMAARMGASPLMVMQNLDVIYGRPSWRAKFLIACFNQCGRFEALSYEFSGTKGKDDWTCVGISKDLSTGKPIRGPEISILMAKQEGWYDKKGSKWKTIPELMLRYRAGAWLINTTAPEISMGLLTDDEIRDTFDARQTGDGRYEVDLNSLRRPAAV